jgi:hypothetical protein
MAVSQAIPLSYPHDITLPLKKSEVSDYLITIGKIGDILNMKTGANIEIKYVIFNPTAILNPNKTYLDDTNIRDLIGVPLTKMGSGLKLKNEPNIKLKIGRGLSVIQQPTFQEYGKYVVHMNMLMNHDLLNLKYKSLGPIPKFKNHVAVSDIFKEFLLDVLETGKPNKHMYNQIEADERKLFEEISIGAGLWQKFNMKRTTTNNDEEESKRFEILRGEILAGNNNNQVITELRKLVIKFMNTGKIRKNEGLNLLMQLN